MKVLRAPFLFDREAAAKAVRMRRRSIHQRPRQSTLMKELAGPPSALHLRGEGHQPLNISTGVDIEQAPIA
jgi:hypothetical protein